MINNVLQMEYRNCQHCTAGMLRYYHEGPRGLDYYYCGLCFGITQWDGKDVKIINGEAYSNRDKK